MLIISHRGYCAEQSENTLGAFRAAIDLGVDGIETDVRLSADGLPILCHDRVTADGREVAMLTRYELGEALGHSVPTLDEALDLWSEGLWNIEIKTPSALEPALDVLNGYASSHSILITSFWHNLINLAARDGKFQYGILLASRPATYEALISLLDGLPSIDCIVWDYEIFDGPLVKSVLPNRRLKNIVYGVKSESEHKHCKLKELAGIITDHPALLLSK